MRHCSVDCGVPFSTLTVLPCHIDRTPPALISWKPWEKALDPRTYRTHRKSYKSLSLAGEINVQQCDVSLRNYLLVKKLKHSGCHIFIKKLKTSQTHIDSNNYVIRLYHKMLFRLSPFSTLASNMLTLSGCKTKHLSYSLSFRSKILQIHKMTSCEFNKSLTNSVNI